MTSPESLDVAGLPWRKSSRSSPNGSDCVEVAPVAVAEVIAVRDSKNPSGPKLAFSSAEWSAFTGLIRSGALDL